MTSPFPGMDPFLEQPAFWPDFHATFINYWREAIADALPPEYEVTLGERVYLVELDPNERKLGFPDVAVTREEARASRPVVATGTTATLEPVTIPLKILDGPRETFVEILHQPERSLVTTLELLSPANKAQPGRTEYLTKRSALLYQDVHLVELDLLMEGRRLPLQRPLPPGDYYYLVSRADRRPDCDVYHWTLRERLPILPVPLRKPDPDILIDLGSVFATAYERGRFGRRIRYALDALTFLAETDREWARAVLPTRS